MSLVSMFLGQFLAAAVAVATPQPTGADGVPIQRMIEERVAQNQGGGIVLATFRPGERPRIYVAGSSGREDLPLDGDTLFEIGSVTKTFTTALLADMVVRGEVGLGDAVADHLPGVRLPQSAHRRISLVDLATHSSGLPALPTNISPRSVENPYSDYTPAMFDAFLAEHRLSRAPGAQFEYSAVGMALLGRALGQRLGMSWEEALKERVLDPLGMTSTAATLDPALSARLAPGHDGSGRRAPNWDIPALPAMGALHTSANDLLKYLAANMECDGPLGAAFTMSHLPRVTMDEETRVGLAWQTGHATNRTIVWHGGGTGGYRSLLAFDPHKKLGVVVLSNSAKGADEIGFHLLDPSLPPK